MSNIYDAIMKAAEHIERHPEDFNITAGSVPESCGTPGCALGWIGHFSGTNYTFYKYVARDLGLNSVDGLYSFPGSYCVDGDPYAVSFYREMDKAYGDNGWTEDAIECAKALRAYAHKYHAPQTPDWEALAKPDAGFRQEVSA